MELTYATIVVLASLIFVLSGMVGYLYWQQTRILQNLGSLAMALSAHIESTRQEVVYEEPPVEEEEESDDDRVSVKESLEVVEGPPSQDDIDDLPDKTSAQLRELLSKKGIPFGKRDSKSVLIQLLKATS
uniref:HeH/LEM domain-containing protein n=1 Tax=viral metagenome TaxID=1070528 RepID=A0A6C0ERP8_9ZZZZ